jgi:hypothetical protein
MEKNSFLRTSHTSAHQHIFPPYFVKMYLENVFTLLKQISYTIL